MLLLGYKKKITGIEIFKDDVITIYFNLKYKASGALNLKNARNKYFDCGDFQIRIDNLFKSLDNEKFKKLDLGIAELCLLKYITDEIPNISYIKLENDKQDVIYSKKDITKYYNKIYKK